MASTTAAARNDSNNDDGGGEETLSALYDAAVAAVDEARRSGGSRAAAATSAALDALDAADAAVARAALFSANEDADDVPTASLRYLLLPSLRAEVLAAAQPPASAPRPAGRLSQVHSALDALAEFLGRASSLGILKGAAAEAAALAAGGDDGEEGNEGSGGSRRAVMVASGGGGGDAGARRTAKIERFRRSKALAAALEQLKTQRAASGAVRTGGGSGGDNDGKGGGGGNGGGDGGSSGGNGPTGGPRGWDEADERRWWLYELERAALAGLDLRDTLVQELGLLRHAAAAAAAAGGGSGSGAGSAAATAAGDARMNPRERRIDGAHAGDGAASRAAMMDRLSGIAAALSLDAREQTRQRALFTPYVPLPTITVEQQGAIELAEARAREAAEAKAKAAKEKAEAERRSDDEDDGEVAQARAWDEFKDDNPYGWGNSKLRPCA